MVKFKYFPTFVYSTCHDHKVHIVKHIFRMATFGSRNLCMYHVEVFLCWKIYRYLRQAKPTNLRVPSSEKNKV